jgi:hypothetical protein
MVVIIFSGATVIALNMFTVEIVDLLKLEDEVNHDMISCHEGLRVEQEQFKMILEDLDSISYSATFIEQKRQELCLRLTEQKKKQRGLQESLYFKKNMRESFIREEEERRQQEIDVEAELQHLNFAEQSFEDILKKKQHISVATTKEILMKENDIEQLREKMHKIHATNPPPIHECKIIGSSYSSPSVLLEDWVTRLLYPSQSYDLQLLT